MATTSSDLDLAGALRRAHDAAGIVRLLELLGYAPVEPPDGVPFEHSAAQAGRAEVDCVHVASGGGIQVVLVRGGANLPAAARVRPLLGRDVRPILVVVAGGDHLTFGTSGIDGRPRALTLPTRAARPFDLDVLEELRARDDGVLATLARHARALDRSAVTRRFFRDFRAQRDAVSRAWSGIPRTRRSDRDQLALLFLSRLLFLYFLQKQGHLLGRGDYLIGLVRAGTGGSHDASLFSRVLRPLFFGVLNTPVADRSYEASRLGRLPYLNGGLFERHPLERAHPELDLPDGTVVAVFESLLERYRFAAREHPATTASRNGWIDAGGIQPEMLGRVLEGLMSADRRERTGTFYTPAAVVDRIVRTALRAHLAGHPGMDWRAAGMLLREAPPGYGAGSAGGLPESRRRELLSAVREVRVLDPACGSGAFVLGALERLTGLRRCLGDAAPEPDVRRDVAATSLHGVDVEPDAALLCALRVWLALTPGESRRSRIRPLPNLDHRVRQGDVLLDPLDLSARGDAAESAWRAAALDPGVRRRRRVLEALVARYGAASAAERSALRLRLRRAELRLARHWVDAAAARLDRRARSLRRRSSGRDLFGERASKSSSTVRERHALMRARSELRRLRGRLREREAVPFFSFGIHFGTPQSGGGFDLVVSNPPWVRSHAWPQSTKRMIRARYRVCRGAAWRPGGARSGRAPAGGQVDLALLFLERGLELLRAGGVLALLLPTKTFRSLSAGAARALVLEGTRPITLEDHSLDHRSIFRADAFAGVLVARTREAAGAVGAASVRGSPGSDGVPLVRVAMSHRSGHRLRFSLPAAQLPLDPSDPRSPWLIVPPAVRSACATMLERGRPLAADPALTIRRGAMTGANDLLLFEHVERKLGDAVVAWPKRSEANGRADGSCLLHVDDVCPVLRGADLRPFRFEPGRWIAWSHDDRTAAPRPPSSRLARQLAPVRDRLRARAGWRPGLPDPVLFRLDATMLQPRVAWRDIATDLEVVRLPARVPALGCERPLVALNTVYFIPVPDEREALALTAILSSLPCRVFARALAERAKDARFRFFAWTVASVPLPSDWREATTLRKLADLAEQAHTAAAAGGVPRQVARRIDDLAAGLFGLSGRDLAALRRFDRWLSGADPHEPKGGDA